MDNNIKYIASTNSNYSHKLYGCFISADDSDYLHFIEGKYIEESFEFKIVYKINFGNISELLKWDILSTDRSFYLINEKVEKLFDQLCKSSIQFIECKIMTEDNHRIDGYKILNVINTSDHAADIIRDKNNLNIYYSRKIVSEIKKNKIKGLVFYEKDK